MFVGEIGIPRREFLYDISFWETRRIYRGYRNRYRDMWSSARWHAYSVMTAMPYVDLAKGGIRSPKDLLPFPWENDGIADGDLPTDDEIDEMQQLLAEQNQRE